MRYLLLLSCLLSLTACGTSPEEEAEIYSPQPIELKIYHTFTPNYVPPEEVVYCNPEVEECPEQVAHKAEEQ